MGQLYLSVFALCARAWFSFRGGRQIWSVGIIRATECLVGEFLAIFRIYAQAQLVLAGGNDLTAGGYRDGRGVALRSSSSRRLAHTDYRVVERISPDVLW